MSVADAVPGPTPPRPGRGVERPTKPPRSPLLLAGVIGAVVMTWWSISERFGMGLDLGKVIRNVSNADEIITGEHGILNPSWVNFDATLQPFLETIQIAVIAAPVGVSLALLVAFLASPMSALSDWSLKVARVVMSVMRSIPDVLYALVMVAAFSIGPLPGILALVMFNIGVVAKLTSESIDAVDPGPLEAADAAGATKIQRIRTTIFPQVLPNYLAYALYTFELNLRASLVLGIVGAGGIGQVLRLAYTNYRYDVISLLVVEIFVIVFIVEQVSITLRRRLV